MTCREFVDFLEAYFSRELAPEKQRDFDRHMAVCETCVAYLTTYEQTIRLGREAFAEPEAQVQGPPEELVQAILEARKQRG